MSDRDTITLPREVVQDALDALEWAWGCEHMRAKKREAIEALRTALAAEQPKPEPVAYFDLQKQVFYWARPTMIDVPMTVALEPLPLYTAPPEDEALRRDAERYRYLRDKAYVWDSDMPKAMRPVALWLHADGNANIDAAIDAAMKEDKT